MAETGTEPPSFREIRERQERIAQARRDAFRAASRAAAGKSRDEIRELYLAELRSRALEPPSEQFLEATVEQIAGNPIPAIRLVGEGLAQMAKGAVGLGRLLRDVSRPPLESLAPPRDPVPPSAGQAYGAGPGGSAGPS